jgi:hypothetical protein
LFTLFYVISDDSDMENNIALRWQGLLIGGSPPKDSEAMVNLPSFIGSIQQFVLNKINFFDLAKISTRGCKYIGVFADDLNTIFLSISIIY